MVIEIGNIISIIGLAFTGIGVILGYESLPMLIQKLRTKRTYKISERIKFWALSKSKKVGIIFVMFGICTAIFGQLI